ncbi:MAG: hypothetical protein R6X34_20725 [Chloroflexota bacterium]
MAIITPYIAKKSYAGQKLEVKAKKFVWVKVGEGVVAALSDYEVSIGGKISILGYNGDLNIHLILKDQNAEAVEGICTLKLNNYQDETAKYVVENKALMVYATLGGKSQNIAITPCNNGEQTECRLFGHVNQTVHLQPVK